ncbi:hypothetical protein [Azospirillum rugosum]|nr:hypothetical protein [Azospirillum rugosum]MDQ0524582.1 hypothetical protein [Azospirillum rugosum]
MVEPAVPFVPVLFVPPLFTPPVLMPEEPLVPVVLPVAPELLGIVDVDPPPVPDDPPIPLPLPLVWAMPLPAPAAARTNAVAAPIIHRFISSSFREAPRSPGPFR